MDSEAQWAADNYLNPCLNSYLLSGDDPDEIPRACWEDTAIWALLEQWYR
jgi:hypothetical protein